jgi:SAM-dependent methyltransferase
LQNFYPVHKRNQIKNVFDFGAGYVRQANLWSKQEGVTYVGMNVVPSSYCNRNLGVPYYDYIDNPERFEIINNKKGVYLLPTWRYELLPDNFFYLVVCIQVLSEMNGKLAKKMIKEFYRILKPGGVLYLRDPGPFLHKAANKVNIDKYIVENGFSLEFEPYLIRDVDLQSFPRIWRKYDPVVEASLRGKLSIFNEINYYSRGLLKKWGRKILGKQSNSPI